MNDFSKNSLFLYYLKKDLTFKINDTEVFLYKDDKVIKLLEVDNTTYIFPVSDYVFLADASNEQFRKNICKNLDKIFKLDSYALFNKFYSLLKDLDLEDFLKEEQKL